jgi:hypothetical protein
MNRRLKMARVALRQIGQGQAEKRSTKPEATGIETGINRRRHCGGIENPGADAWV